jgi:hypothetical protein
MLRRCIVLSTVVALAVCLVPANAADEASVEGKVAKVAADKLTLTDKNGKDLTYSVPATAKVTCDGKECKLMDLKAGFPVKVIAEKNVITKVEAKKS